MMTAPDSILWKRFVEGDDEAYAAIYNRHVDALYAYGACFTKDKCLLEDCIHDLFVKLHRNRRRFSSTGNIKFYLFMALKHQLLNALRDEPRTVDYEEGGPAFSIEYTAEDRLIDQEQDAAKHERVRRMLETLNPHQKEIIYYRFEEGLSYEEIAALMHIKPQSAQNIMQRALKKLRETFSADDLLLFLLFFVRC